MCNNPSNEKIFSATLTVDSNVPGCTWDANQSNRVQARLGRQRQRCRQRFKFYSRGQQTLNATHKMSRNDQDVMQKSHSQKPPCQNQGKLTAKPVSHLLAQHGSSFVFLLKKQSEVQQINFPTPIQCEVSLKTFQMIHHLNLSTMSWRLNFWRNEMAISMEENHSLREITIWAMYAWEVNENKSYWWQHRRKGDQKGFKFSWPNPDIIESSRFCSSVFYALQNLVLAVQRVTLNR